jgi:hypothetical protein
LPSISKPGNGGPKRHPFGETSGIGLAAVHAGYTAAWATMGALIPRRLIETMAMRAVVRERTSVRSLIAGIEKAVVRRLLFTM